MYSQIMPLWMALGQYYSTNDLITPYFSPRNNATFKSKWASYWRRQGGVGRGVREFCPKTVIAKRIYISVIYIVNGG